MSLEVIPEELPIIGAQIDATRAGVDVVLGAAMPLTKPVPADSSVVGAYISGVMALFGNLYFPQTTVPGVAHLAPGTTALVESATAYAVGDVGGAATVTASAADLAV
ncbi:hypothetical protein ACFROC_19440 [Nocardia tengchongensis]|uniref:hypothetical protein n=1 Tax=Nocardia tengchongensis TaxID=2055889 RepID=UPI00367C68CC